MPECKKACNSQKQLFFVTHLKTRIGPEASDPLRVKWLYI